MVNGVTHDVLPENEQFRYLDPISISLASCTLIIYNASLHQEHLYQKDGATLMTFFRRLAVITLASFLFFQTAQAASFVVRNIEVLGLQRVTRKTVISYLPIHIGQRFDTDKSVGILKALYKTGFFRTVRLKRRGGTLIVWVIERPTIGLIRVTGNDEIATKRLKPILKKLGIVEGNAYDSSKLNEIKQGLTQEYGTLGYHAAKVNIIVTPQTRNRIILHIKVSEGKIATVRSIKIIGNKSFSQRQLLKKFKLSTPGIFSFFSHDDRYSKTLLDADLPKIKQFYLNHGYLRYKLVSKKVNFSKDNQNVGIVLTIKEGPVYRVSGSRVTNVEASQQKAINKIAALKVGKPFSRKKIVAINKKVAHYYANQGYAFSRVQILPKVNDKNHTIFVVFKVVKGRRVYVRRIHFTGNDVTADYVMRSQMRQMEGGLFSLREINESKRRIANLSFLKDIKVQTVPVPGDLSRVDLNYHVTEVNSGRAQVSGGWSDVQKWTVGANLTMPNFLGSGKYTSFAFQKSKMQTSYSLSYNNPFYKPNGLQRGFNLYYSHTTPGKVNLEAYTMDDLGGSVNYMLPMSEYNQVSFGMGYDHIIIGNINYSTAAPSVTQFMAKHPSPFNQIDVHGGISRVTTDRAIFPTDGASQSLSLTVGLPINKSSVGYWKSTYNGKLYVPLGYGFIVNPTGLLGYGGGLGRTKTLPFYSNFYAGGIDTLPGFSPNTLGPKNPKIIIPWGVIWRWWAVLI